ncbi:hypothetical protein EBQ91_04015 [bacterium]|nr:hypothetical protein [bacterium]
MNYTGFDMDRDTPIEASPLLPRFLGSFFSMIATGYIRSVQACVDPSQYFCKRHSMNTKSVFLLLALSSSTTGLFAFTPEYSGQLNFDYIIETSRKNNNSVHLNKNEMDPDILNFSELKLNISQKLNEHIKFNIQLSNNLLRSDHDQITSKNIQYITQAFTAYKNEIIELKVGLIPSPDISLTNTSLYLLGIENRIGRLIPASDNSLGFRADGLYQPFSYNMAVWRETSHPRIKELHQLPSTSLSTIGYSNNITAINNNTAAINHDLLNTLISPDSFSDHIPSLALGIRLGFTPVHGQNGGYCIAGGWNNMPLNIPIVVATLAGTSDATFATFNYISNLAADFSAVTGPFHLTAGVNYQRMAVSLSSRINLQAIDSRVFTDDGSAYSWWVEGSYLLGNKSYTINPLYAQIDKAGSGLELGMSFGIETQRDIFALLNKIGRDDFLKSVYTNPPTNNNISGAGRLVERIYQPTANNYLQYHENEAYHLVIVDNTLPGANARPYVEPSTNIPFGTNLLSFQIKTFTNIMHLNYRPDENIQMKFEFQHDHHLKEIFGQDFTFSQSNTQNPYVNSINYNVVLTMRMSAIYNF